jgi:hypothetical protein
MRVALGILLAAFFATRHAGRAEARRYNARARGLALAQHTVPVERWTEATVQKMEEVAGWVKAGRF